MKHCDQFPGFSVLEHGLDIYKRFRELYLHLSEGKELESEWKLPDWVYNPELLESLLDLEIVKRYQVYHDCGKPFCREEDEKGVHFPDHAARSKAIWLELFPEDIQVATLIGMDMDAHTLKADDIEEFISRKESATLLITALCEIHSNAMMCGGTDTTSFKIKWKKLNRIGKRWTKSKS